LERELDELVPEGIGSVGNGNPSPVSSRANVMGQLHSGSLPDRILQKMGENPTHLYTAEELLSVAGESTMQTLRATLLRLKDKKRIERPRRGRFRLPKGYARQEDTTTT